MKGRSFLLCVLGLILLVWFIIGGLITKTGLNRLKSEFTSSTAEVEMTGALTMQGSFKAECSVDKLPAEVGEKNDRTHVRISLDEGWILNLYSPYYGDDEANRCPPGAQCLLIFHTLTPTLVGSDRQTVYSVQTPADGDFNLHFMKQENVIRVNGELKNGTAENTRLVNVKATVTCQS